MVWSGLFPNEGGDYSELREALDQCGAGPRLAEEQLDFPVCVREYRGGQHGG